MHTVMSLSRYGERMAPSSRRTLGLELRRLRGARRAADVAGQLGWSESKLSRIETARTGIAAHDLENLLDVLNAPGDSRAELRLLAQEGRQRTWWSPYRTAVSEPYDEYVALEAEAGSMREWEAQVVPGLLQTDEYARAVIEAGAEPVDPSVVERRVALRMARQAVLTRHPAPTLSVVLDEGVLHRGVGGPEVMRRQLRRLVDSSGRRGVVLQVLPFRAGQHGAMAGSFTLFSFAGSAREPVVHCETMAGGVLCTRPAEVRAYAAAFADLCSRALDPAATRDLLQALSRSPRDRTRVRAAGRS